MPEEPYEIPLGQANVLREGNDVTVVGWGRMVNEALDAAEQLAADGIDVEVIDPRTLQPLDTDTIIESVRKTNRVIVVHEAVRFGGLGAEVAAQIQEEAFDYLDAPVGRIAAPFSPVPFTPGARAALPAVERRHRGRRSATSSPAPGSDTMATVRRTGGPRTVCDGRHHRQPPRRQGHPSPRLGGRADLRCGQDRHRAPGRRRCHRTGRRAGAAQHRHPSARRTRGRRPRRSDRVRREPADRLSPRHGRCRHARCGRHDAGAVVALGGDGTCRDVAIGWPDAPLIAISTGTNNVFPTDASTAPRPASPPALVRQRCGRRSPTWPAAAKRVAITDR